MAVQKTSAGRTIDMEKLKLYNEHVIAVGNADTNARGDLVRGGKIIKTREQLAKETYNLSGNNVPHAPVKEPLNAIEPDDFTQEDTPTQSFDDVEEQPRGSLASKVAKNKK